MGVCCTGKQRATYPSCCFGTPSIVSPWPRLTLNCCPKEPLQNITKSKAFKLLDAIWSPFVVWNNNQALYVMDSSRKLCRVYETPRLSTTSVAWSVLSKRFRRVATVDKEFELKASVIYLLSIQFKYILRRGLKTLQAMLILHSSTKPGSNWQETRMPDEKSDTCEVTLWSNSIPYTMCCYSLLYKASYLLFDTKRFKF